ncbi:MAG: hypothetical protein ACR2QE_20395 [Acidimicrobiales bacterium]
MSELVVHPRPTAEEAVAIAAAHEALWPRPVVLDDRADTTPPWRFSGRWWMPTNRPLRNGL